MVRHALALSLTLALSACSTPNVDLRHGPRTYTAESYEDVLRRWTREGHVYTLNGLEDQLAATATYQSWDFRWAYAIRYAADFRLSTDDRTQFLQTSLGALDREHEFYVALYTQAFRWGELTRPTSAWRVLLVNDRRQEVAPVHIDPIQRPGALERTYFPYTTEWRQVYRVRFPRTLRVSGQGEVEVLPPGTRYFILRFSGPLGSSDLVWNVGP